MKKYNLALGSVCSLMMLFSACKKESPAPSTPSMACFKNNYTINDTQKLTENTKDDVLLALAIQGGIGFCIVYRHTTYNGDTISGPPTSEFWSLHTTCDIKQPLYTSANSNEVISQLKAAIIKGTCFN